MNLKTFEIRVTNTKDTNYLKSYIYQYRHWQNLLTILTINLFKSNNSDYKHFLDYAIIRACIAGTKGDKKIIEYLQLHNVTHLIISTKLAELKNNGNCNLRKSTKQNFIQIPFIQLLNYIEEKATDNKIEVIKVDEAYTSKTSCISSDVCDVQEYSNGKIREESTCTTKPKYNGKRTKRGLFKDTIINKVFNADLNGAVNHIKLVLNKSFKWLANNLSKLCNPLKLKSAGELHNLICNIRSNKSYERRTTARAYIYSKYL